jgi:Kdo2-lipid IVA lauroyltransferase/acyltransferase
MGPGMRNDTDAGSYARGAWIEWKVPLIRLGSRVRTLLPRRLAMVAAHVVGDVCWLLLRARRRTIASNLARTAADRSPAERRRLCRATFRNFAVCVSDFLAFRTATRSDLLSLVSFSGLEPLMEAHRRGRGVIVVSAHLGNPELAGIVFSGLGYRIHSVAERTPPGLFDLVNRYRTVTGLRVLPLGRAGRALRAALAAGDVVALVSDRVIGDGPGEEVDFAGGRRRLPSGPAELALAAGAPLFAMSVVLSSEDSGRRYHCTASGEIPTSDLGNDPSAALTARIGARLGECVRRHPDQWFVFEPGWTDAAASDPRRRAGDSA